MKLRAGVKFIARFAHQIRRKYYVAKFTLPNIAKFHARSATV